MWCFEGTFLTQRPFWEGKARKKTDIAKSREEKQRNCFPRRQNLAPSQQWKWWRKPSDGWLAVEICIPELSSDNRACDTTPYILSNIYDFTLFTLSMMVILNAVYTVVLVLLKDQWWYMWAVRAMNQEAFYLWAALLRTQVSEALVPLEERWTWINPPTNTQLRPSVQKLSLLLLLIFNSHPPILADPVQSRRIKVKVDMKRMKWTQNTDCDFSASDLRGTSGWSLSNSCATMLQCAAISYSLLAKSEYKSKQADVTFSLIQLLNAISSPSSPRPS